ncbi:MAG: Flp family type IVb pilin [Actinobacteria bacterium]|nr:Flp family type IVb pilin [Actinomycetota bacterium]
MASLKNFFMDERGQGTTEYAIIVVLIAVALIGTLMLFKSTLIGKFNEIINSVRNAR